MGGMITPPSKGKSGFPVRVAPRMGDLACLLQLQRTSFFRACFHPHQRGSALWGLFRDWLRLNTAIMACLSSVFWRTKHGGQSYGLIMWFLCVTTVVVWNYAGVHWIWKPFVFLLSPVIAFFVDDWHAVIFQEIHSGAMVVFMYAYAIIGIIHVGTIYTSNGNEDRTKRGDSHLEILLRKLAERGHARYGNTTITVAAYRFVKANSFFVPGIVEPVMTAAVGLGFWWAGDPVFATLLWMAAGSTFLQEATDYGWNLRQQNPA